MAYPYTFGNYPAGGYYPPPMPDQLGQLRQNAYQQPMMNQPVQPMQNTQPQAPAAQPSNGVIWVQGEEGAKAYMVAPNATVLLMDSDGSSFYLKSADASGMPLPLRIFDYTERIVTPKTPFQNAAKSPSEDYVTRAEFETLEARFDALNAKETKAKKTSKDSEGE